MAMALRSCLMLQLTGGDSDTRHGPTRRRTPGAKLFDSSYENHLHCRVRATLRVITVMMMTHSTSL